MELTKIINPDHSLARLARKINWDRLERTFGLVYCPNKGRPAISTRLMVTLHYFKYIYKLSDENVVAGWVENPYWQHFSGMYYFEHKVPVHPSSMCRWRKRIANAGAEQLLQEILKAGLKLKGAKPSAPKKQGEYACKPGKSSFSSVANLLTS